MSLLMIVNVIRSWLSRCSPGDRGAAAVEFAITAPLLVILAIGAADYGAIMNNGSSLEGATRAVAEYARDSSQCAGSGLASSTCTSGINSLVSTLQTNDTSLSSASFKLPNYPSFGTTSTVPLPAPSNTTPPCNYCTCTDGTVVDCATGACSVGTPPDTRVIGYIRIMATLSATPLVSYASLPLPSSALSAQTTTRTQ